jgi:1,5-anhydro-D-fructose reductase (1,5-anhydro-D-mannitol-forming)
MGVEPVGIGILGYGHFVRQSVIEPLRACESIRVVGVYNRGEERRSQAAEDGFWTTGDLDELLAREDVEAVYVATHNAVHRDHAVAAARAGKHILCEKPLALTLEDVDQMVAEAQKAGVVTHVNHGGAYHTSFRKLRELARDRCGKLLYVWVHSGRGFGTWIRGARHYAVEHPEVSGGWTFHHYCHSLNLACTLLELESNPVTRVYHVCRTSCPEAPSEEICSSLITFADGATAQVSDGLTIGGFRDLGVYGTDGDAWLVGDRITLVTSGPPATTGRSGGLERREETFDAPEEGKGITRLGHMFARAVRSGDGSELISFRRACQEYRILDALAESARSGQVADVQP